MKKLIIVASLIAFMSPVVASAGALFSSANPLTLFGALSGNSSSNSALLNVNVNGQSSQSAYSYANSSYSSGTQCSSNSLTLCSLINRVIGYLNQILFLLIGLSIVTFVYFVFKYFIKPNENHDEAGKYVMYSVIGFFVILSMWGLVNILQNTFGFDNTSASSWSQISNIFPR
jgi:hypothetical protein